MVVSFTISKKGKIYRPQPKADIEHHSGEQDQDFHSDGESSTQAQNQNQNQNQNQGNSGMHSSSTMTKSFALFKSTLQQLEALGPSFSLNLFENGFTIGTTEEIYLDVPENLVPYSIDTDSILTDVECGRLPTRILQDLSLKYVNGTVLCEVRDYRVFIEFPVVETIPLKMGLDNIVEDMSLMSKKFSYGDMLEFQSTVLKFLYPYLNLDPTPNLEFNSNQTIPNIDLGICKGRKRRRTDELTDVDTLLHRFLSIDTLTRRHGIAQRKPMECPNIMTSSYTTNLISTCLNEVEMEMNDL